MNSSNQNSKNSVLYVIPTVRVKEKFDNNKSKNAGKNFSKIPKTKCYKCKGYGHVVANCPSPFKIDINDGVLIEAHKSDNTISSKVNPVIKEFIDTRPFPSSALLPTPPSPPPLLLTPVVVSYFSYQLLPPLLATPSPFLL